MSFDPTRARARRFLRTALCLLWPLLSHGVCHADLAPGGAAVLDMTGAARNTFTNTEQIMLRQTVSNTVASVERIVFTFQIFSPAGAKVFQHVGNAAPGSAGNAQTQVSGIPVSQFYTQPGAYSMVATASLGAETVQQQTGFTVSSPNITLIYPPNGARDLSDSPVVFRWVGSGASTYRISVDITPSFYYSLFTQTASGASFSYPANPPDPRQNLSAGQVYYWKVEGLDSNGNKISDSGVPYDFTLKGQASALTRDLAVIEVSITPPALPTDPGPLPFMVKVANQGGTNEANVPLKFTLGGLPAPESPQSVTLGPGTNQQFSFHSAIPPGIGQSLAIACLEFFDDNVTNNCKTLQLSVPGPPAAPAAPATGMSMDQAWQILQGVLGPELQKELQGYQLIDISGMPQESLNKLLEDISKGAAKVSTPAPPQNMAPPLPTLSPLAVPVAAPSEEPPPEETFQDWSGRTMYLNPETVTLLVRREESWQKIWKTLSPERVPKVDFSKYMVLGVIAGTQTRAEWAHIESIEPAGDRMVVRYKLSGKRRGSAIWAPFHLRTVLQTRRRIVFEDMK